MTLALAELRTGAWEDANHNAERCIALNAGIDEYCEAILAMARYHLGQFDAARASLARAKQISKDPKVSQATRNLIAEAEALLAAKQQALAK